MKNNYKYAVGALVATSAISWGALLYYHFNDFTICAIAPAIFCLIIAGAVEGFN